MEDKNQDAVDVVGKIIMPMIRKVMPSVIAHQILSVQPMIPLSPNKTELRCGTAYLAGKKAGDWFTVFVVPPFRFVTKGMLTASELKSEHYKWAQATFGPETNETWFERDSRFYFRKESDQTMFVLRWAE